jgi:hypothetical protein
MWICLCFVFVLVIVMMFELVTLSFGVGCFGACLGDDFISPC